MQSREESKKERRAVTYKNTIQRSSNLLLQNVTKDVFFERGGGTWQREYGRGFGSPFAVVDDTLSLHGTESFLIN